MPDEESQLSTLSFMILQGLSDGRVEQGGVAPTEVHESWRRVRLQKRQGIVKPLDLAIQEAKTLKDKANQL